MTTIIIIAVVGLFLVPSVFAEGGYSFLGTWGTYGSGSSQFDYPYGIAVDGADNVYVADSLNDRIQKFDPNGTFLTEWGTSGAGNGQFSWPAMIAIDSSGNTYVSDFDNYRIQKFGPNGTFLTAWGTYGSGDGQFDGPDGMALDNSGNIYVSDWGNNRIQKFGPNGTFLAAWGAPGSGDGQFSYPEGVATNNSGSVYVADWGNNRIQKFGPDGAFLIEWGASGSGSGQFEGTGGIAVDNSGNLYVADWGNDRIQKFGPNGIFITAWGTSGSGNSQFIGPIGIAVNSSRNVYVTDTENSRIQVFSPERFADTPLDYWATPYIEVIYQAGYSTGYGGTNEFKPEYEVTREQMAAFITRALIQVPPDGDCGTTNPFPDVAFDRWSCKNIKRFYELGITSGYPDGRFGPDDLVTREQMAVFLTRALGQVPADGYCGTENPFTDVAYDRWSCENIKRLYELGITTGYGDGGFRPDDYVTRAQMAAFLSRAFLGME